MMIFLRKVSKYFILFIIVNIVVETSGTVWDRTHNEKGLWGPFYRTPLVDSNAELTGSALFATIDLTVGVQWWLETAMMTFCKVMTMSHSDDFSSTDDFRRMIIHLQRPKIICNNNIVFNIDILVKTKKKNLLRQQKEYVASPEKKVFKTNFSRPP